MTPTTTRRSRLQVIAVLAVLFGLLAAACGSSSDDSSDSGDAGGNTPSTGELGQNVPVDAPGVTDTEIRYSVLATETNNPFGTCILQCYANGVKAYFDYVNTEMDGIYGRQLVADDLVDDEFTKNQEKALEIVSDENTFGTFSSTAIPTGWQLFADDGIPLYVWATQPAAMVGNESIWGESPVICSEPTCPERAIAYMMKDSGRHKLASVGYGIAQSSKDCASYSANAVELYKDQIGPDAEAVYVNDSLQFGFPNGVAPEITAMKDAGADILVACIENTGMKTLMDEAERQGLDIIPLLPNGYDEAFLAEQGGAFDGGYLRVAIRSFQATPNPAQEKYREYMDKLGGEESEISIYGWINASLAYEGLVQAGPEFDREKVIEATNALTGFTAGGLTPPINWGVGHEAPSADSDSGINQEYQCWSFMKIVDSSFELVGDADKPFTCWSGMNWDWTEGQPESLDFE
jgi:hypothetical protein